MRKCLWALMSLMFLFTACNNEEDYAGETSANVKPSERLRFYGVAPSESMTRGVAQKNKLWHNGTVVNVKFLNGAAAMQEKVKKYAAEWEEHANITFKYVASGDADIRIGFDYQGGRYVTWSYTGTDCKTVTDQSKATANFVDFADLTEAEIKADILRLFGQILGLELEHRHLEFIPNWKKNMEDYWTGDIEDIPWATLTKYVFDPLQTDNVVQTKEYDALSIMQWAFPRGYLAGSPGNDVLSEQDIVFIKQLYPKTSSKPTVFTFTEAVDLTLSDILVEGNVKITVDGVLAYEGNVSSAPAKLRGTVFEVVAKKLQVKESIPRKIKTVRLVDTEYGVMQLGNQLSLTEVILDGVPYLSHTDYYQMFVWCEKLITVPEKLFFNCPNAENFKEIFAASGIVVVPPYLFSKCVKAKTFYNAFVSCFELKEVSEGLFSGCVNVENFHGVFYDCFELETVHEKLFANCERATDFGQTFFRCYKMKSIPENTFKNCKKAEDFYQAFQECNGLTSLPKGLFADCIEASHFGCAFAFCENLTTLPKGLFSNCVNATHFGSTFSDCKNLTFIPEDLFAKCLKVQNFGAAFHKCFAIQSKVPELWKTHPTVRGYYCFEGVTNAANYADIPTNWR